MGPSIFGREPVMYLAIVQAALALALAFGFDLSPEQIGAVVALTSALLGWLARSQVTPVEKLAAARRTVADPDGDGRVNY